MAYAFISSLAEALAPNGGTSGSIDTTGADFIYYAVAHDAAGVPVVSDSKLNTWTALTAQTHGAVEITPYYTENASSGTSHTFTVTGIGVYAAVAVQAFSGGTTTSADQTNGANNFANTLATGSVTPSENNELVITPLGFNAAGTPTSIDSSFTGLVEANFGSGNNYGVALAYLIQTAAAAVNPTWTRTGTNGMAVRIDTFKAASTTKTSRRRMLVGIG